MKLRTWPFLSVTFGCLIVLIAAAGFDAFRRASQIYAEISSLHETYQAVEHILGDIESEIHLSEIYVRDYLLDPSHIAGELYRGQLRDMRSSMQRQLDELASQGGREDAAQIERLRAELDSYWESLQPLFSWSPGQKIALSTLFLRKNVLPRRDAVLEMAREVRTLNDAYLKQQQRAIGLAQQQFRRDFAEMLALALVFGTLVAVVSLVRISRLERRAEIERNRIEEAEKELRQLSLQLVQAQEEERKVISRNLHDEVGQMLTALRVELGTLEQLRTASATEFGGHLEETKRLSEATLRTVRDLSLGLRPSMLDDLGLAPALEWQARDFSRRFGVPVDVQLEGELNGLPERHRTCVYRVVQEALTNCARHAQASSIRIVAHGGADRVSVTVQDDGVGMAGAKTGARGLGLVGIQERVRELGGSVTLFSQPDKGTVLTADIPILNEIPA
jgi:signal transduction histidine kinase